MRLLPRLPRLTPDLAAYIGVTLLILWGIADKFAPYHGDADTACRITYVYDGDTVAMQCGRGDVTARIVGLNAPETRDAECPAEAKLGAQATVALRSFLREGAVQIFRQGYDRYGRDLVVITVGGGSVATRMVEAGFAEAYSRGKRRNWCG
jgi:micrococcal nuclease